jgi:phosphoenolpyruvate carboxykinase (ATP)
MIPHSSACVKAVAEGTISWERDPDFGYEVATGVPGIDDPELLKPRLLHERQGRVAQYEEWVARLKKERAEFLSQFPSLSDDIRAAVR